MLRAAIKHGISKALSSGAGFEVWDFEIREEQPAPERVTVEIRYRYQPNLFFTATVVARSVDGRVPVYEITAEAVPGEVGEIDELTLAGRDELCKAIERWTTRIEEELSARPSNRVLAAQQKAISYLEKHLLDVPEERLTRDRIVEFRRRLERLEAAVIEIRAPRNGPANDARADEVREEFACLRRRLEVLGERSFLHSVLVRLVKYFWDDENLRIIEAGSRAAQDFLKDKDHPLSLAGKADAPAVARAAQRPEAAPRSVPRPAAPAASRSVPKPVVQTTAWAAPKAQAPAAPQAAAKPAPARTPAKPEAVARPEAAARPQPKPAPPVAAKPKIEARITAKPDGAAPPKAPAAAPAAREPVTAQRQRAAYKPLRPNRG